MTYSGALFTANGVSLEEAQEAKYALIEQAAGVRPGDSILEIGCGWGGMAGRLARAGAHVKGITVSRAQLEYAKARLEREGLAGMAALEFLDYRDLKGTFDGIVSIEMIEAVGEEHLPDYFNTVARSLKPGRMAAVQAITIREQDFELYRSRPDFIQRYIFPGGMLPTVSLMREHARRAGLEMEVVGQFGRSYARTLAIWRERFQRAWPAIGALGFDERFRRMWDYYLTYCEVAFETGMVDVGVYRFAKGGA